MARAQVQARVYDQEDRFDDALERGVLTEEIDSAFSTNEYISGEGVDADEVQAAVDRLLSSPDARKSRREIVIHGIRKQDEPTLSDFIQYAESHGLDGGEAVLLLEKLVKSGKLDKPTNISIQDLESKSTDFIEASVGTTNGEAGDTASENAQDSTNPQKAILYNGIGERGDDAESVIGYAVERGMSPENAVLRLEKMVRTGESTEIQLSNVEELAADILGEDLYDENDETEEDSANDSSDNPSQKTNRSQKEIMADAIRETGNPTREDVIEYATRYGISHKKAEQHLEKMLRIGEVTQNTKNELRLL